MRTVVLGLLLTCAAAAQPRYDLLPKGGHVIDPKNGINGPMDIAIAGGKFARVARAGPSGRPGIDHRRDT
jgi:dihydroorotase